MSTPLSHLLPVSLICASDTQRGKLRQTHKFLGDDNSSDRHCDNCAWADGQGLPKFIRTGILSSKICKHLDTEAQVYLYLTRASIAYVLPSRYDMKT